MPEQVSSADAETPLHELFDRDPLKLSEQDLALIVVGLRKQYKLFNEDAIKNAKAGNNKKPKAKAVDPKKAEAAKAVGDISALL